ncbi:hypothetical protein BGZ95_009721 [Linnemannia exigua]|uniref:F-box domain-containing protein n=1 Tax=Linnemannia exigua TaxID=604196 RepID=A0AAD4H6V3_9FUNG|nr:hypothetical protein BGZ95_009721 [Linnemannia exigua]
MNPSTPPLSISLTSSSSHSSSSSSSVHSLYDNDYGDRGDSGLHKAVADYSYQYNHKSDTYTTYDAYEDLDDYDYYEPEDNYDDYDDICLVPPSPLKPKSKRNNSNKNLAPKILKKQPAQTKIIQPLLDSSKPPELPLEILELVCLHLSQPTLRYGVNRVCKKWHEVSNPGIWRPVDGAQEQLLQQWPKFNTLELSFCMDPEFPYLYVAHAKNSSLWTTFTAAITEPTPTPWETLQDGIDENTSNGNCGNNSATASTTPSCLIHSIRNLEMRGCKTIYNEIAPRLRGHLQFVESLTITTSNYNSIYPLFTILADFPALKSFFLHVNYGMRVYLRHGDDDDLIVDSLEPPVDPETAHFPRKPWVIPPPKMFPDRYSLQRFTASGTITHLRVLERLLVTCPDLRVFNAHNNEVNMFIRQRDADADLNARQRLIDLGAAHCPKLEWYNFHRVEHAASDGLHIEYIARTFPNHKILSMNFDWDQDSMPSTFAARNLLSRITVLDIKRSPYEIFQSSTMNRILCLTPNLLHLVASNICFFTGCLYQPPAPIEPARKPIFHTVRDRKRYERNERRQARQQALARFQPHPFASSSDDAGTDDLDTTGSGLSIPVTWQLYNLKTLEMGITATSSFVEFSSYISRHRLFRNLVILNLHIPSFKVGQRETFVDSKKPSSSSCVIAAVSGTPTASNGSGGGKNQHMAGVTPLPEPARFPNELLALRSLRCLEECIFRTHDVPGMLLAKDFEFMRRKDDFQTMSFLPKRPKSFTMSVANTTTVDPVSTQHSSLTHKKKMKKNSTGKSDKDYSGEGDGDDSADDNSDDEDDDEESLKTETFWPKLNTFQVYYLKMSPILSASKLVSGIEEVRPGVAFSFKFREAL